MNTKVSFSNLEDSKLARSYSHDALLLFKGILDFRNRRSIFLYLFTIQYYSNQWSIQLSSYLYEDHHQHWERDWWIMLWKVCFCWGFKGSLCWGKPSRNIKSEKSVTHSVPGHFFYRKTVLLFCQTFASGQITSFMDHSPSSSFTVLS